MRAETEDLSQDPLFFKVFFFNCALRPLSSQKVCASVSINTLKIILASRSFSSFLILLSTNYSTLHAVICDWCREVSGRKEERQETSASDRLAAPASWFFCPVCMFINLSCPGRLFICALKCPPAALHQRPWCRFLWQKHKYYLPGNMS